MKSYGGEFLGDGAYGCVFYPTIPCANGRKPKKGVSKVFNNPDSFREEYIETKQVKKMDPTGAFTNPVVSKCEVKRTDIEESDLEKCAWINDAKEDSKFHQLVYRDKGIDFKNYLRKKTYTLTEVIQHLANYAKAVALLGRNKYTHLDIKGPNMLITDSNKAILIDFGMSKKTQTVYDMDNDYLLDHPYYYYPPEFRFFMKQIVDGPKSLQRLKNKDDQKYIGLYKMLTPAPLGIHLYDRMREKYNATIDVIQMQTEGFKTSGQLEKFYTKEFASKIDVFSLGVVILEAMRHVKRRVFVREIVPDSNKELREKCENIGFLATHINPYERADIDTVVRKLNDLLPANQEVSSHPLKSSSAYNKVASSKVASNKNTNKNDTDAKPPPAAAVSIKTSEHCMKLKVPELKELIKKHGLPPKLKYVKKAEMCKALAPYVTPKPDFKTAKTHMSATNKPTSNQSKPDEKEKPKRKKRSPKSEEACKKYTKKQLCEKLVKLGAAL